MENHWSLYQCYKILMIVTCQDCSPPISYKQSHLLFIRQRKLVFPFHMTDSWVSLLYSCERLPVIPRSILYSAQSAKHLIHLMRQNMLTGRNTGRFVRENWGSIYISMLLEYLGSLFMK